MKFLIGLIGILVSVVFGIPFVTLCLMSSALAQDFPHVSPESAKAVAIAQRDRAEAINQATALVAQAQQRAQQMVQQAQQRESEAIAKAEKESGCKVDPKTVECIPVKK